MSDLLYTFSYSVLIPSICFCFLKLGIDIHFAVVICVKFAVIYSFIWAFWLGILSESNLEAF